MQPVSSFNVAPTKRPAQDELEGHDTKRTPTEDNDHSNEQVFTSEPSAHLITIREDINLIFNRVDQALNSSASDEKKILSLLSQYPYFISWTCSNSLFLLTNAIISNRYTLADWMLGMIKQNPAFLRGSSSNPQNTQILLAYAAVKGEWEIFNQISMLTQIQNPIYCDDERCAINNFIVPQEEYLQLKPQICLFNLLNVPSGCKCSPPSFVGR